jgi:amino-acid N-acetyltransferase
MERCCALAVPCRVVEAEELVKRTRAMIDRSIDDYFIFEIDGNPVACVALHGYPDQQTDEIASLYVSAPHENQGIGRKLVQFVEDRAMALGLTQLIALSTQAFTYFQSKAGFVEGTPADLPAERRDKYDRSGRNSKVLLKRLPAGGRSLSGLQAPDDPRTRKRDHIEGRSDSSRL